MENHQSFKLFLESPHFRNSTPSTTSSLTTSGGIGSFIPCLAVAFAFSRLLLSVLLPLPAVLRPDDVGWRGNCMYPGPNPAGHLTVNHDAMAHKING